MSRLRKSGTRNRRITITSYPMGAATLVGYGMGRILDHYKTPTHDEYSVWPLAPIPFALIGALLISRLWNVVPGRKGSH